MEHEHHRATGANYLRLGIELSVDFVVMYLVMYTMIATLAHFHVNLNNVYMTLMMVAPMVLVMLVSMRAMFPSPRANIAIGAVAASLTDPEIVALCRSILDSQQREIAQMQAILQRY